MRLSTFASAAALAPAIVSAAATYSSDLKATLGKATVHNNCDKEVYLWSVKTDEGCSSGEMQTVHAGKSYSETYRDDYSDIGVSIKISWEPECKGVDITQLEYHINHDNPEFLYNFLDISFVDCTGQNCPGRDSLYFKSGNNGDSRLATAGADKAICPIFSCSDLESCGNPNAAESLYNVYLNWDDLATKTCEPAADTDLYLCSSTAEGKVVVEDQSSNTTDTTDTTSTTSTEEEEEPTSTPVKVEELVSKVADKVDDVSEATITSMPVASEVKVGNVKTEVVYVTEIAYVNAKRHTHGHRHQPFRA